MSFQVEFDTIILFILCTIVYCHFQVWYSTPFQDISKLWFRGLETCYLSIKLKYEVNFGIWMLYSFYTSTSTIIPKLFTQLPPEILANCAGGARDMLPPTKLKFQVEFDSIFRSQPLSERWANCIRVERRPETCYILFHQISILGQILYSAFSCDINWCHWSRSQECFLPPPEFRIEFGIISVPSLCTIRHHHSQILHASTSWDICKFCSGGEGSANFSSKLIR